MANLTTGLPRRTGDIETDFNNLYNSYISFVDEVKQILCNLDSGNVIEAASVKAQNIDVTQARIKDAQIASLTADKLTAGTIDTGKITIYGEDKENGGSMQLTGEQIVFLDKHKNERIIIGNVGGEIIFTLQNAGGTQGVYMNADGEVYMTGNLQTDKDCRIWGELIVGLQGANKGISIYGDTNSTTPSALYGKIFPYVDASDDHIKGIGITSDIYIRTGNGAYKRVLTEADIE